MKLLILAVFLALASGQSEKYNVPRRTYTASAPASSYTAPSIPSYSSRPRTSYSPTPAPSYVSKPAPAYVSEPAPAYVPEPAPAYVPEPAPAYAKESVPSYASESVSSYGAPKASYGYGSYGGHYIDAGVFEAVDSIYREIESQEARENTQTDRVNELAVSANANIDFANNYRNFVQNDIRREQNQQDYRLHALEQRIARINAVRSQVNSLNAAADAARAETNRALEVQQDELTDINNIRNDNAQSARIAETQVRANDVMVSIDEVSEGIDANTVSLSLLEVNVRRVIDSTNRDQISGSQGQIFPAGVDGPQRITIPFNPAFYGFPQVQAVFPVGFQVDRRHSYGYEYPSIYVNIDTDAWSDRVIASSVDMSTGGFSVNHVAYSQQAFHFGDVDYVKSYLDGI